MSATDSLWPSCDPDGSRYVTWAPWSKAATSNADLVRVEVFSKIRAISLPSSRFALGAGVLGDLHRLGELQQVPQLARLEVDLLQEAAVAQVEHRRYSSSRWATQNARSARRRYGGAGWAVPTRQRVVADAVAAIEDHPLQGGPRPLVASARSGDSSAIWRERVDPVSAAGQNGEPDIVATDLVEYLIVEVPDLAALASLVPALVELVENRQDPDPRPRRAWRRMRTVTSPRSSSMPSRA